MVGNPNFLVDYKTTKKHKSLNEKVETVAACSCPCCNKCWLYITGDMKGLCVHGGPYKGYIKV